MTPIAVLPAAAILLRLGQADLLGADGLGWSPTGRRRWPDVGAFGGIVIGITAALLWQRYYRIKLVPWLAFFGGRRFVPILMAPASTVSQTAP